ncbi:MAG: DUF2306 domain-containing protein [Candidatus Eisenbacteria bacterium]|nr:DUF2306 domain-containing protein [Candidatus Eisenbacteria bacterium]
MSAGALAVSRRPEWLIPGLLILLSLVPAVAGTIRLAEVAPGAPVSETQERFGDAPIPLMLHILAVIPFSFLGALQFAPAFRRRNRTWHRTAGKVLVVMGFVAALTGLWIAHFYPWAAWDGVAVYVERLVFGMGMLASLVLALVSIGRRDFVAHGDWMTRAYAIGLGAGTQVFTHLPYFLLVGQPGETGRGVMMGAGWVINVIVAEWVIRRRRGRTAPSRALPA